MADNWANWTLSRILKLTHLSTYKLIPWRCHFLAVFRRKCIGVVDLFSAAETGNYLCHRLCAISHVQSPLNDIPFEIKGMEPKVNPACFAGMDHPRKAVTGIPICRTLMSSNGTLSCTRRGRPASLRRSTARCSHSVDV